MKTFEKYLKESFINIDNVKSDSDLLRLAIQAELDASSLYEVMAKKTSNPKIKEVMLDVANEEKIHVGEFQGLLKEIDDEYTDSLSQGEEEVKNILQGI